MVCTLLITLIRGYQIVFSPLMPSCCRFYPSCSEYAVQALRIYGLWRGLTRAAWRLLRCHPLARGGVDLPVLPQGKSV